MKVGYLHLANYNASRLLIGVLNSDLRNDMIYFQLKFIPIKNTNPFENSNGANLDRISYVELSFLAKDEIYKYMDTVFHQMR